LAKDLALKKLEEERIERERRQRIEEELER
jgi:hypothetical protein